MRRAQSSAGGPGPNLHSSTREKSADPHTIPQKRFTDESSVAPLPAGVLTDKRLVRVLEAARWAPFWMNRQPWRFILLNNEVLVYKMKQQNREGKDYHFLDCGIAMAHLHLAAKDLGMGGRWVLEHFEVPGAAEAQSIGRYLVGTARGRT